MNNTMMNGLEFWGLQTIAMLVTAFLIPGLRISGPFSAFVAVLALALLNIYFWDAALFFKVPDTFSLHTVLLLAVNGVLFWLIVKILPGMEISGCLPAIAAPIVFTICSILIQKYGKTVDWGKVFTYLRNVLAHLKTYIQQAKPERSTANLLLSISLSAV